MNNKQNLVAIDSTEKARELGRKGGKASGISKRKKKLLKEQFELLLSLPLKDANVIKKLEDIGINNKNIDNQMAMVIAMWNKAIKGDIQAFTVIRDTLGEKPTEKVEQVNSVKEIPLLQKALESEDL